MDSSPSKSTTTVDRFDNRISRYVQRIQQLINRDRSRSPSPYNPKSRTKLLTKGPMINRLDTYIKYEHSLYVLAKFMQTKESFLVRVFFNELKLCQGQKIQQKIYRFVPIRVMQPDASYVEENTSVMRENRRHAVLLMRIRNLYARQLLDAFEAIRSHKKSVRGKEKGIGMRNQKQNRKVSVILLANVVNKKIQMHQRFVILALKKRDEEEKYDIPVKIRNVSVLTVLGRITQKRYKMVLGELHNFTIQRLRSQQQVKMIAIRLIERQTALSKLKNIFFRISKKYQKIRHFIQKVSSIQKLPKLQAFLKIKYIQNKGKKQNPLLLLRLHQLFQTNRRQSLHKISQYGHYKLKILKRFSQITQNMNQITLCQSLHSIKTSFKHSVAIQHQTPKPVPHKQKSEFALTYIQNLGRITHLLELKYQYSLSQAFFSLIVIKQTYTTIIKGFSNIQRHRKEQLHTAFKSIRSYRKPQKHASNTLIPSTRLIFKILKTITNRQQRSAFKLLIPTKVLIPTTTTAPTRKLKPPSAISLCRCLDRLYKRSIIPSYTKLRCHNKSQFSDTADTIFNQVLEFLQDRTQNFQKIQQNYRKLKSLAGHDQQLTEPQHFDSRSVILSLKTKILQ